MDGGRTRVTILDGGMGKELHRVGAPFRQPEWSALALWEAPDTVAEAHRRFIDAGAEVIITNAYALVPYHIGEERYRASGADLIELAAMVDTERAFSLALVPPLYIAQSTTEGNVPDVDLIRDHAAIATTLPADEAMEALGIDPLADDCGR